MPCHLQWERVIWDHLRIWFMQHLAVLPVANTIVMNANSPRLYVALRRRASQTNKCISIPTFMSAAGKRTRTCTCEAGVTGIERVVEHGHYSAEFAAIQSKLTELEALITGKNGAAGSNCKDGADGQDGANGKDGADGKNGADGKDGARVLGLGSGYINPYGSATNRILVIVDRAPPQHPIRIMMSLKSPISRIQVRRHDTPPVQHKAPSYQCSQDYIAEMYRIPQTTVQLAHGDSVLTPSCTPLSLGAHCDVALVLSLRFVP